MGAGQYIGEEGDQSALVLDYVEGKMYDGIGYPVFSPDSQHIAYPVFSGDKISVVVDNDVGVKSYDFILYSKIIFDSPNSFHYLAQDGNEFYLVEETINN